MSAIVHDIDVAGDFFAPASLDVIDGLVARYSELRSRIEKMGGLILDDADAVSYFLNGNRDDSRFGVPAVTNLFEIKGAIAALNSDFWQQAMNMTDVHDCMPQARRDEWHDSIKNQKCPDFEEGTVRATLGDLLASRSKFFAERVDGIFRALSGQHVTNRPEGFSKRMIMQYVVDKFGYSSHSKAGTINDLRCVIAKFMGRDEPNFGDSSAVIKAAMRNPGQWMIIDGGAIKLRVYNGVGTGHIEIHPDMAYRLNSVLAMLHPAAIPAKFRKRPKQTKRLREFALMDKLLPFEVIGWLAGMKEAVEVSGSQWNRQHKALRNTRCLYGGARDIDKHVLAEVETVLSSIGGTKVKSYWQFDYEPTEVIDEIICSGRIPDHKSHQFYPTPPHVARIAVGMADISGKDMCIEPSAGQGAIAELMPKHRTICVEVSDLHTKILKAKGLTVIECDFLAWAKNAQQRDVVVMNPPYSQGRWQAHTEAAARLVKPGGRIVAILPASARNSFHLDGFSITWSDVFDNEFSGTGISVVIMRGERAR